MGTLEMGGRFEGYEVILLGRVGDKEVYSLTPAGGGSGVWITIERSAGDVSLQEIVDGSNMVSAHTAWLKYLMERSTEEKLPGSNFGFGNTSGGDADV